MESLLGLPRDSVLIWGFAYHFIEIMDLQTIENSPAHIVIDVTYVKQLQSAACSVGMSMHCSKGG